MIRLSGVTLVRAGRVLLEQADAQFFAGQKVGVVGANGSGKSSLFALLRGELLPERGDASLPAHWAVASVAQETPALARAALNHCVDGDTDLRALEAAHAAAQAADDGTQAAEIYDRIVAIDGFAANARAAKLLAGLGFNETDLGRPVAEFSGGWRVRLNVAQALMRRSDQLLLDEPTKHQDLDAVLWLEAWLKRYPGTLLVISHDRDFLDNVVQTVCELEGQRLTTYAGNYSAFERARAEQLAQQQAAHAKQLRQVAHLNAYINRFRAQATKARQAQSRLKALARMEVVAAAQADSPFEFAFREPPELPHHLLSLENATAGYAADRPVLAGLNLRLEAGDRLGVLGRNGAGKSTLIKTLAGELAPPAGERKAHPRLRIGYFAQHQLEQLDPAASPLLHVQRLDARLFERRAREQELRDFLGGFDFRGEAADRPVGPFSGGEKARLALALVVWARPNLLLLDEPTNHLDLRMREALNLALQDFGGAVVLVSHDRHLLRTVCDRLVLTADGRVGEFEGDLDDYAAWLARQKSETAEAVEAKPRPREQRRLDAQARDRLQQQRRPLLNELKRVEADIARLEAELAQLDGELADPAVYEPAHKERLRARLTRQRLARAELSGREEAWLQLQEALEAIAGEV